MKSDGNWIYKISQIEIRPDNQPCRIFYHMSRISPRVQEVDFRNQPGKIFDPENVLDALMVKAHWKRSQHSNEYRNTLKKRFLAEQHYR